jgi:exopolysaccharide biosynthesis polyprenyl glycosylphosphotransferase
MNTQESNSLESFSKLGKKSCVEKQAARWSRFGLSLLLIPLDATLVFLAYLAAFNLAHVLNFLTLDKTIIGRIFHVAGHAQIPDLGSYIQSVLYLNGGIILPLILFYACFGLYRIRRDFALYHELGITLRAALAGQGFVLFLFLLQQNFFIPRSIFLYSSVLVPLFLVAGRQVMQKLFGHAAARQLAVIGNSVLINELVAGYKDDSQGGRVVAELDSLPIPLLTLRLNDLDLDEVIVVNDSYSVSDLIALRDYCLARRINFGFVPALLTTLKSSFEICHFSIHATKSVPTIYLEPTPLDGWGRVFKRIFDIFMAIVLLLIWAIPLIIIAVAIKINSPGPLLYKHKRLGLYGREIAVWKFRSMKWEFCTGAGHGGDSLFAKLLKDNPEMAAEWAENHKIKNDPRVSGVGRFLRKYSLDELPQFFNVLGGSLSLVGPRPIVKDEIDKYGTHVRYLFLVKPGVTGLWQVSGRNDTSYEERIRLDSRYIERWNLGWDISIMFQTVLVLVGMGKGGAY